MADKKVILANYKSITTNVKGGGVVSSITTKETIAKVSQPSIPTQFLDKEIDIYFTGVGETSIPDANIGYYLSDGFDYTDSIAFRFDYGRLFEFLYSTIDSYEFLVGKGLVDIATTSEELSKESTTQLTDDKMATTDVVTTAAGYKRYFEENTKYFASAYLFEESGYTLDYNFKFIDNYDKSFGKNVVDSFASFETFDKSLGKNLAETLSFTESFDTLSVFNLGLSDTATTGEILTRQFVAQRSYADTFTRTEIKTANIQNYFGASYSQTGYVGTNYAI
jgi:hypothetical protein